MAFRSIGLGAVLKFSGGKAVAGMNAAGRAAQAMSARFVKARAAATVMAAGLKTLAIAGTAMTVVLGLMTSKAAGFEQQMANIKAVAVTATEPQLKEMTRLAKELGATTAFTAVQAGEAMETLTRAGFNANEVLAATPAVLNAAAAEGIGLAEAADLVAKSIRIMGLEATDAGRVSDVLALASARSNTTMLGLGEAFKFGGAQAKILGISLEETTAIFGKLADSGLKGSLAGTSFTAMMIKLAAPSKKAASLMKKWEIKLTDTTGKLLPVGNIVEQFSAKLGTNKDVIGKSAIAIELFGRRGAKAFGALAEAGGESLQILTDQLILADGAAKRMAEIRLDTFKGQLTLLQSAVEGFSIEIGSILLPTLTSGVKTLSRFIGDLAVGLGILLSPAKANTEEAKRQQERWGKLGSTAQAVVTGMVAGINILRGLWDKLKAGIETVAEAIGTKIGGDDGIGTITKIGTVIVGVMAVAGPIFLLLAAGFVIVSAAVSVVVGAVGILTVLFWPLVGVIVAVIAVIKAVKKDGESSFGAIIRIVTAVWGFLKSFIKGVAIGLAEMWEPIKKAAMPLFENFGKIVKKLGKVMKKIFGETEGGAETWGATIGAVIGKIIEIAILWIGMLTEIALWLGPKMFWAAKIAVKAFGAVIGAIITVIGWIVKLVSWIKDKLVGAWNFVKDVAIAAWTAMKEGVNSVIDGLKKIISFLEGTFLKAWEKLPGPIKKVINDMMAPIKFLLAKLERIVALLRKIPGLKGGLGEDPGRLGPLPVSPGPTPATASVTPPPVANVSISGGDSSINVTVVSLLDGREIARSTERFKASRHVRSKSLSPGQLREFAEITSVA